MTPFVSRTLVPLTAGQIKGGVAVLTARLVVDDREETVEEDPMTLLLDALLEGETVDKVSEDEIGDGTETMIELKDDVTPAVDVDEGSVELLCEEDVETPEERADVESPGVDDTIELDELSDELPLLDREELIEDEELAEEEELIIDDVLSPALDEELLPGVEELEGDETTEAEEVFSVLLPIVLVPTDAVELANEEDAELAEDDKDDEAELPLLEILVVALVELGAVDEGVLVKTVEERLEDVELTTVDEPLEEYGGLEVETPAEVDVDIPPVDEETVKDTLLVLAEKDGDKDERFDGVESVDVWEDPTDED